MNRLLRSILHRYRVWRIMRDVAALRRLMDPEAMRVLDDARMRDLR